MTHDRGVGRNRKRTLPDLRTAQPIDLDDGASLTHSMTGVGTVPEAVSRPARSPQEPVVAVDHLVKVYANGVKAVDDISFAAGPGEVIGIVGPNGAGKSTTLNILATLIRPSAGKARISGYDIHDVRHVRPRLGVALQVSGLDPLMNAREHFEVTAALYKVPRHVVSQRQQNLISLFDLQSLVDRPVGTYSLGIQRRLSLALALLHDPRAVIMDEPTAGLDPSSKRAVWSVIAELRAQHRTIILSTQHLEEADALCQQIYVIDHGRVIAAGSPTQLRSATGSLVLRVRVSSADTAVRALRKSKPAPKLNAVEGNVLIFRADTRNSVLHSVLNALEAAHIKILELSMSRPTLEDAFLRVTGSPSRTTARLSESSGSKPDAREAKGPS